MHYGDGNIKRNVKKKGCSHLYILFSPLLPSPPSKINLFAFIFKKENLYKFTKNVIFGDGACDKYLKNLDISFHFPFICASLLITNFFNCSYSFSESIKKEIFNSNLN